MTTNWTTESIVREVLRRLAQLADSPSMAGSSTNGSAAPSELRLPDRVVTLALVDGKLDGISRVVVRKAAVITPAVRDELKQRNIHFTREDVVSTKSLAVLLLTDDPKICLRQWKKNADALETFRGQNWEELSSRAAEWVDPQHVAIAWSQRPVGLACRMNKQIGIRAVAAQDAGFIARAIAEAGANVLVLDSSTDNDGAWRRSIQLFRTGEVRSEPTD